MPKPPLYEALGHRLRLIRRVREMTLGKMAEHFGVSVTTLKLWEAGQRRPLKVVLQAYAALLRVPIDVLLYGGDSWDAVVDPLLRAQWRVRREVRAAKPKLAPKAAAEVLAGMTLCSPGDEEVSVPGLPRQEGPIPRRLAYRATPPSPQPSVQVARRCMFCGRPAWDIPLCHACEHEPFGEG